MNIDKILATIAMIGSDLPAYQALFNEILQFFDGADQEMLKERYAEAMKKSDEAHRRAQEP